MAIRDTAAAVREVLGGASDVPVLLDPDGTIASAYRIGVLSTCVFIDREGRIAKIQTGATTEAALAVIVAGLS